MEDVEEGWGGHFDAKLSFLTGNADLQQLGGSTRVQYQRFHTDSEFKKLSTQIGRPVSRHLVFLVSSIDVGRRKKNYFINRGFSHLRWVRRWIPLLSSEVFIQHQFDDFKRLQNRVLIGSGARVPLLEEKNLSLNLGSGVMLELERLSINGAISDPLTRYIRLTEYLAFSWNSLDKKMSIVNTLYYQPRVSGWSDYRILNELDIDFSFNQTLSFVFQIRGSYDHEPPQDVKPFDLGVTQALRVRF